MTSTVFQSGTVITSPWLNDVNTTTYTGLPNEIAARTAADSAITGTLASSSGSSTVGYTQGGAGAVTSTVQNKLRESVSVKDFGAVGNGTTDDTAAIQAAINAAYKFSDTYPGLSKGKVYFPPGVYLITSTLDASSIGAMYGESRHECVIKYSGASTTITCNSGIQINELAFLGTGTQTALNFPTLAYLSQVIGNSFYNFAKAINYANSSGTSTYNYIELNIFQSCTIGLAFTGIVTTTFVVGNQFNTGTTAISCGNNFSVQVTNNVFEDVQTGILIPNGGVFATGLISGNWFERSGASLFANIIPYQDNSVAPGFFLNNTFSANRYVNAGTFTYGINGVVTETGEVTLTTANKSGNDGRTYSRGSSTPAIATALAFTAPNNYTFQTQSAVASLASPGGDYIFDLGAGSSGQRYGAVRPAIDNVANLGDTSYRWLTAYIGVVKQTVYTVATLPSASTSGAGAKAFVSDATATTFASTVVGGGANNVPVYSDGTNWKIG